ncbi:hypothetical protein, partial [Vibrio alginolyticus]|uniref:hypothetical protein n=1 Tax=Vibrio alginolyticus TaxID=663 RepID=UPI001F44FA07
LQDAPLIEKASQLRGFFVSRHLEYGVGSLEPMFLFLKANMCVSKQFAIKLLSHRVNHPDYPSYTLTSIFHFN